MNFSRLCSWSLQRQHSSNSALTNTHQMSSIASSEETDEIQQRDQNRSPGSCSALIRGVIIGTLLSSVALAAILTLWLTSLSSSLITATINRIDTTTSIVTTRTAGTTTSTSAVTSTSVTSTTMTTTTTATTSSTTTTTTSSTTITTTSSTTTATTSSTTTATTSSTTTATTSSTTTTTTTTTITTTTVFNSCTNLQWNQTGIVVAGTGLGGRSANQLGQPYCVYIDATGALYICDYNNNRIQKWLPGATNGSTVAGDSGGNMGGTSTLLNQPTDITFDINGNMYVADMNNNRVQMFAPNSTVGITVAGQSGGYGNANNQLNRPMGIAVDASLNVYVADTNNRRLVQWAPNATTGTVLIDGNSVANGQLSNPYGIILMNGSSNQVYLSDNNLNQVQLWTFGAAQANKTLAGVNLNDLRRPTTIMFDPYGNLYVADSNNNRIQMFCVGFTNGTTVAGGSGSSPSLSRPSGIAFDSNLNLYVSDTNNNQVLKYKRL